MRRGNRTVQTDLESRSRTPLLRSFRNAMPVNVAECERAELYARVAPKLAHLLERRNVPHEVICALGRDFITTVGTFARTGRGSEEKFLEYIEKDIGVVESDPGGRSLQARLLDAWDAAKHQKTEVDIAEAKTRASGMSTALSNSDQVELRKAYAEVSGDLEDDKYPSYSYINIRLEELEEGELVAERLDEITSRAQEKKMGNLDYAMEWTKTGEAVMKKHKLRGSLPTTTEDYRDLYKLRRHQWGVVRVRHGHKPFLLGLTESFWYEHVEYMLGDRVRGLCAKAPTGETTASITWHTFLGYDQAVMEAAIKQVNIKGSALAAAVVAARKDNELRTTHLVTQLALNAPQRQNTQVPVPPIAQDAPWKKKRGGGGKGQIDGPPKGNVKGKGKIKGGRGKGNGKQPTASKLNTARRHNVVRVGQGGCCFAFNKPEGCPKKEACEFKHICVFCEGAHSIEQCGAFARWIGEH